MDSVVLLEEILGQPRAQGGAGLPRGTPVGVLAKPAGADCNLQCTYCFYLEKAALYPQAKVHRMSLEVARELVRQKMEWGGSEVSFGWQGGEPTLMGLDFFRQIVAWQQEFGQPGQVVSNGLQTNALLLDEEWAEFLREYRFLVGVSLDGPEDIHDHYRRDWGRKGTFRRVMENIALLQRKKVEFNILCVVNAVNVSQPERLWDFFMEHGLFYLQFIPCVELDPRTGRPSAFSIAPEQYGAFLCRIFDRWRREEVPQVYVRFFNDLLGVYLGQESPTCLFRQECGDYVVVEHNGDVYACDFFVEPSWRLGNLMERPLWEIVQTARAQAFRVRKRNLAPECQRCGWLHLCYGECPKYRIINGGVHRPTYFCASYKRFFSHAHPEFLRLAQTLGGSPKVALPQAEWGRNDPCPCGSGKKFKRCCGQF